MRHLQLFEDMNPPQTLKIYLYEVDYSGGISHVVFLAPDSGFMGEIMKYLIRDKDADEKGGLHPDDINGIGQLYFTLEDDIEISREELLKLGINLKAQFEILSSPSISFESLSKDKKNVLMSYYELSKEQYKYLSFDAEKEAKKYSKLTNDMLDQLCVAILKYRTWDNSKIFKDINP